MTSVTPVATDADRFPIWSIYPTYFRVILKRRKKTQNSPADTLKCTEYYSIYYSK